MKIPYYGSYISQELFNFLKKRQKPVAGVADLFEVGQGGGLESKESLQFLCDLYSAVEVRLAQILRQREIDRQFIDQRVKACHALNQDLKIDFLDPRYETLLGQEDAQGRIVIGPHDKFYSRRGKGDPIAPLPKWLNDFHVTLFGPPDDAKLSINAMNAFHRKMKDEPAIVTELLNTYSSSAKWGADDEDSKTPLRSDLIAAGENLTGCFKGDLHFVDPKNKKEYRLENDRLALPIKRFPGLALPSSFLFYKDSPIPLHLYDFALHLFENWHMPQALSFYVPKLENEEEAAYIHHMVETAEKLILKKHPGYKLGSIRLFIVLENPRALFRVNEIMDALHPYFAGASLGWHDYLASTARLLKEDANYRIPVKADPDIVIKYIKASHDLLAEVVGSRGGIKIGGMYGVLPMDNDIASPSFQVAIKGFIKDVVTQLKRNLSGFWVAHPDFVRIAMALVESWKFYQQGDRSKIEKLVMSLLDQKHHKDIMAFIDGPDIQGLNIDDPMYARSLIVADIKESNFIANNHPDEIRYNVFQSLQYLTDWLSGNGCVALPAQIEGVPVRVMDDLATAERSRWEVWHELYHGRFGLEEFLKIAHEEMTFIRKDLSNEKKIVQVKWDEKTAKWYPIAMKLMIQLMTAKTPVEFATELLMPFTVDEIRNAQDPWDAIQKIDPKKYSLNPYVTRFDHFFSICGSVPFAKTMANNLSVDLDLAEKIIKNFDFTEIKNSASFHGDIGESKKTLDHVASKEQNLVLREDEAIKAQLKNLGAEYLKKFGVKFLISAQGKDGKEILGALKTRIQNTFEQELQNARIALWEISLKRLKSSVEGDLRQQIAQALSLHKVLGAQVSISTSYQAEQSLCFGKRNNKGEDVTAQTWFEVASLSKTVASCFAVEYFRAKKISLSTSVNALLAQTSSGFRIGGKWGDEVALEHLMNHGALNMHYVNGVPANKEMPPTQDFLNGNETYGYKPIEVVGKPGSFFQYSGGGFLVLEHLIESLEKKKIQNITEPFFKKLGLQNFSFEQKTLSNISYANAYLADGTEVEGGRKMFPAFAAGAMATASDITQFLSQLAEAFRHLEGCGSISHDTAMLMLHCRHDSQKFMAANIGLGVFIAEAGANRLILHQGANDGFRCLYVYCYQGPNLHQGFTILCNADTNGVLFVAEVAQKILQHLNWHGVDASLFQKNFDPSSIPQEQVVNLAYKDLIFRAFIPDLPKVVGKQGERDPMADKNLAVDGKIIDVTNQRFARAENFLSDYLPTFDPEAYDQQGKLMDSWETVRHNQKPCDELIFEMQKSSMIGSISVSTKYHFGNQAQAIMIEGMADGEQTWRMLLPKTELRGHSIHYFKSADNKTVFKTIRVSNFPDGGLTRLGLFAEPLPESLVSAPFTEKIAHAARPLMPIYKVSESVIQKNWSTLKEGDEVDIASAAFGAKVLRASNEHYGPAIQIISPFPPLNMYDGFESARSRDKGHFEEVEVELARKAKIHRIEIDFSYYKNNNPYELKIEGLSKDKWITLVEKVRVKAYAGNKIAFSIENSEEFSQLKFITIPDGGMNRVHVYSYF